MRNLMNLCALAITVLALSAIGATSASASGFTFSATGSLVGKALNAQVWKFNGGTVECNTAATTGTVNSTSTGEQLATVNYGSCTAFSLNVVEFSAVEYRLTASGQLDILNTFTIKVLGCTVTVGPQQRSAVSFENNSSTGKIIEKANLSAITYTTNGGVCGSSGSNGTYTGNDEIEREGGGNVAFDPPESSPNAKFTATNNTGNFTGAANSTQSFTNPNGTISCNTAATSGKITSTAMNTLSVEVAYGNCKFLSVPVNISKASYTLAAASEPTSCNASSPESSCNSMGSCNNAGPSSCNLHLTRVSLNNKVTINVNLSCELFIEPQNALGFVGFSNSSNGITEHWTVTGIKSNGTGGACTPSNNGLLNGDSTVNSNVANLKYDT
jgi:hypothetical protein